MRVYSDGVHLTWPGGESDVWKFDAIERVGGAYRGQRARFERGASPTEVLVVDDLAILDAINVAAPDQASRFITPARRRRRVRIVLATGLVALAAGVTIYAWGTPILANYIADRVPRTWERQLGAQIVEMLAGENTVCRDENVVAAVDRIVNRLAEHAPEVYDWDVRVIDADMINAFAAPGGFIVVHSALLERTERPEELAGVLAHEMQHVLNHHGIKALVRQLPFRLLLGSVMGDASMFTGAVEAIGVVGLLRYQRRDEEEADRRGLAILQAAAVDPEGMPDFFEILQREALDVSGVLTYLSTHPNTGSRIAVLDSLIAAGSATPVEPLLPGIEWETTRAACFASSAGG